MSGPTQRVLVLGLNYPPEHAGVAPYTGAMAEALANNGIDVRVLTTHPHYPGWKITTERPGWRERRMINGVLVVRLLHYVPQRPKGLRRALSELSFGLRVATARWSNPDVVVAVSPALLTTWLALIRARLLHRGTPVIVWVQDLYTVGMSETAQFNGIVLRAMRGIEGWVLRRARRVVVIHDRFARKVADDFGVPPGRIDVVRNWTHVQAAPAVEVSTVRDSFGWRGSDTVVLHAGNMGIKQGLDSVIEAARLADERAVNVRFILLGDGGERDHLRRVAADVTRVEFLEPLSSERFLSALRAADVLLVNELPGVAEMAVPSKLTSYFDAGRPIVAATDERGITAEELRMSGAGIVVPAGDPTALLDAVIRLGSDSALAHELGSNGARYRRAVLDEHAAIARFSEILASATIDTLENGASILRPPTAQNGTPSE